MSYDKTPLSKAQIYSIAKELNTSIKNAVELGNALNNIGYCSAENLVSEFAELLANRNEKQPIFETEFKNGKPIVVSLIGSNPKKWYEETDFFLRLKKSKQI